MMNSMERESSDEGEPAKRSTKKVCIRETEGDTDVAMDSASITEKPLLWKDRLMRTGLQAKGQTTTTNDISNEGEFELSETNVVRSSVNGIPSINFSEWVNQILINNMAYIMVIKLLGRSTGYSALYNKVLPNRPTMVHGFQHNTTLLTYGHGVDSVSWIARAHGQRKILWEIGKLVGKVAKLYFNMAEIEGIQEQGTGLGNETGLRKRGSEVSLIMKEVGLSHMGLGQQGKVGLLKEWIRGQKGVGHIELDIGEETSAFNLSLGQHRLNEKSPLIMGLG
ncbi:hypothetical protein Goshw_025654 [Gossypium schwendimanii]|uniref:Uncharacterized protein n=1 Tax=Gossypium schwendimanii TaxID=34291 RepID=A0A7J9MKP7_GOSSC|nr:hypothetical protein [Gossypium schwendimanii]